MKKTLNCSVLSLTALFCLSAHFVHAATDTWVGGGATTAWNSAGNWLPGNPAATGDTLVFDGSIKLINTNSSVTSITGLTFASTAGAFQLGGNALTVTAGGITDGSTNTQTIANALTFTTVAQTISVATGGNLILGGTLGTTLSGGLALTKSGAGTLALNEAAGSVANGSSMVISSGVVELDNSSALAGSNSLFQVALNVNGGLVFGNGLTGATIGSLSGAGNLALVNNSGTPAAVTLRVNETSSSTYSGTLSGLGGLDKEGTNTLTLSGSNTYLGDTTIGAGTVHIGVVNALPTTTTVTMSATAALDLHSNLSQSLVGLSGSGTVTNLGSGTSTLTIRGTSTFGGVIQDGSGHLALVKSTGGTFTLNGANTYSGTTSVTAGTLLINGNDSGATGAVTVGSSATLGGAGTIGGNTIIQSGGTLSPGNSPGLLTFNGSLTLAAGSNTLIQLTGAGGSSAVDLTNRGVTYDAFSVGSALTLNSTGTITIDATGLTAADIGNFYIIANWQTLNSNAFDINSDIIVTNLTSGLTIDASQFFATGAIQVVPEPSEAALLLLGVGVVGLAARRRQRGASSEQ